MLKPFMLVGVAFGALMWSGSAAAQAAGNSASAEPTMGEIVVTAQRRSESIQRVPVSIVAIPAATFERLQISSTDALMSLTPGLQLSKSGGFPQPFLRGIGNDRSTNGESSVATYIDGVYIAYNAGASQDFYDVERVEVLRGPQGALYGRNSTGGAINIVSKKPSDVFNAKASLSGGNYNYVNGKLYVTGPVGKDLAASIAVSGRRQDGFNKNISPRQVDGFDSSDWGYFGRAKLLWTPGNFQSELSLDYMKNFDFDNTAFRQIQANATGFALGGISGSKPFQVAYANQIGVGVKQFGATLHNDLDLGFGSLVTISAYRDSKAFPQIVELGGTDVLTTQGTVNTVSRQFSQEVQLLSSKSSSIKWLVGGLYFHEKQGNHPYIITAQALVNGAPRTVAQTATDIDQLTDSYAAYGLLTVPIVDRLSATAQLRYTWENRSVNPFTVANLLNNTVANFSGKTANFNALTYRFGLDYQLSNDLLLYVQHSRGYKAGAYNLASASTDLGPVNPEVLRNYEGGAKIEVIRNMLRVNLSVFHYDVSDLQVSVIAPGSGLTVIRNAASAKMTGGEVEIIARPVPRLQISTGLSFLDAKYGAFTNYPLLTPSVAPKTGNTATPVDLSGGQTMRSPKFTSSIDVTYTVPLKAGSLLLSSTWYHNSGFNFTPAGSPQPAFDTVNAAITYELNNKWSIGLWGKNIFDERYFNYIQVSGLGTNVNYGAPVTYGATISLKL